jgi:hypothetical protein
MRRNDWETSVLNRDELSLFAERQRPRFEDLLKAFVQVLTVSADPVYKKDIERGVDLSVAAIESYEGRAFIHRTRRDQGLLPACSPSRPEREHRLETGFGRDGCFCEVFRERGRAAATSVMNGSGFLASPETCCSYSVLSAIRGSTRAARRAGNKLATSATAATSAAAAANDRGSVALIP